MGIKINDRFSIERDPHCWLLVENRPGISKTGEVITTRDVTFYTQLDHVCESIVNKQAGVACQECRSIIDAIKNAREEIIKALSVGKSQDAG